MNGGFEDLSDLGAPLGTPMVLWTSSFRLAYSVTRAGVIFNGWPDGQPAEEQPQSMLAVFDVMRDEAITIMNEAAQEQR